MAILDHVREGQAASILLIYLGARSASLHTLGSDIQFLLERSRRKVQLAGEACRIGTPV